MTIVNTIAHADWRELARRVRDEVGSVSAVITDCPYSERTHSGHDGGTRHDGSVIRDHAPEYGDRKKTKGINYAPWAVADVDAFVDAWAPLTRGWMVSLTDDVLWPAWRDAMERNGRLTFAGLPMVDIGSRVRLTGDGPSSWSCWLCVSRPRDGAWLTSWRASRHARGADCALPGWYVQTGKGDRAVMGGKRSDAMIKVLDDYSEPGDLVADPCCGGGTTLLAAKLLGRRFVGSDISAEHVEIARERLRDTPTRDKAGTLAIDWGRE